MVLALEELVFFHLSVREAVTLPFSTIFSVFASKATQVELPGMHAVLDKQHATHSLLICTDIFGEKSASDL